MDTNQFYNQRENYHMSGARKRIILSLVPDGAKNVLDIGCGNGDLAEALNAKGLQVTGVDISAAAVDEAKKFLHASFCFDIEETWPEQLVSQKFDLIIASELLEHIFDPELFLKQIKQLVGPNGRIIVTSSNVLFWKNRLKMLFGKFHYDSEGLMDYGHIRLFTLVSIRAVFKKVGLSIELEKHFYPNLYKRKLNFLGKIFPGLLAYNAIFLLKVK